MAPWVSGGCTACGPELKSPAPLFKKKNKNKTYGNIPSVEEEAP